MTHLIQEMYRLMNVKLNIATDIKKYPYMVTEQLNHKIKQGWQSESSVFFLINYQESVSAISDSDSADLDPGFQFFLNINILISR